MLPRFIPVETPEQIVALAEMARGVWHEYFPPLLPEGQIDYMVERFQSEPALTRQISEEGYSYFFICEGKVPVGYTGVRPDGGKLFLSKLYLTKGARGKGYAGETFRFLEERCRQLGLHALWLTVNRHNGHAIAVYRRKGLRIVRTQVTDIGHGYVMDDYVMEKEIPSVQTEQ